LALAALALAAVVALTWLLEHAVPPPYSGYLAVVTVGFVATAIFRRQPRQRALKMFRAYLHARERGADESAARARMLTRLYRRATVRSRAGERLQAAWVGATEKDRVLSGVAALLADEGKRLEADGLDGAYDETRNRFLIRGWDALPQAFVDHVRGQLDEHERTQLDGLMERYRLFEQRFFRSASALGADSRAGAVDFARLLNSTGNHLRKDEPGDAERAYRLSLRLRPDENLAHAGLALLLQSTGRNREATREATMGLKILDGYAQRAVERNPTNEDIYPFRSPQSLREALERVMQDAQ
jgi:hypothetical protein